MTTTQQTQRESHGWWTIVHRGSDPTPAKGPFPTRTDAEQSVQRFRSRYGADAGTYEAVGSVRIVGPFRTRDIAREVDISDYAQILAKG